MKIAYRGYEIRLVSEYPGVRAYIERTSDYFGVRPVQVDTVRRLSARAAYRAAIRRVDKMVDLKRRQELRRRAIEQVNQENQREIEELAKELGVADD